MLRRCFDGTLGAISVSSLKRFLRKNDVSASAPGPDNAGARRKLASRADFQDTFEKRLLGEAGAYLFLEGAPGIGKTTFCKFYSPLDKRLLPLGAYCISESPLGAGAAFHAQPDVFCDWLSTTISAVLYGRPSRQEPKPYASLVREIGELLRAISDHCRATERHGLLFIDGVNELEDSDPGALGQFAGLLPLSLPPNLSIILTAPNFAALAARLSGHIARDHILSLPPLGEQACRIFCRRELIRSRRHQPLVRAICERAQGHPLYLRYLITYANSHPEDEALSDFPVLDGAIEHYYERIWTKLLEDPHATTFLRILARARRGLARTELLKVLTEAERSAFTRTIARIQHLLAPPDYREIYHFSFAAFVLTRTGDLDEGTHQLLADFCTRERAERYSRLNVVFHLLRSGDVGRDKGVKLCDQPWVDACVGLGAEPDVLLSDVKAALQAAIAAGNAVQTIRLLLLSQRVTFRYDVLFAQSAHLVAEALIQLQRPKEALSHAIRFNTLIVGPEEAQSISFALIKLGYVDEALQLLHLLLDRCVEAYAASGLPLDSFVETCRLHIRTLLLMRLADGNRRVEQVNRVFSFAQRALTASLKGGDRRLAEECMDRISSACTSYLVCFHDAYPRMADFPKGKATVPLDYVNRLLQVLFEHSQLVQQFNLPRDRPWVPQFLADIDELLRAGAVIDEKRVAPVVDLLIQSGAPASLVALVHKDRIPLGIPSSIRLLRDNGVDVDFHSVYRTAMAWRALGYLGSDVNCPQIALFTKENWLAAIERLIGAFFYREGRSRRAKGDGDEAGLAEANAAFGRDILPCLAFTLAQRAGWERAYGIPESIFPFIYGSVSSALLECFPEQQARFLQQLLERAPDQFGLYSEGYRTCMYEVLRVFTREEPHQSLRCQLLDILGKWRDHVLHGVENRHELVPELLKLIPLFVKLGAHEEGNRLFQQMLAVSMGPTWYKEDQLGLMSSTLAGFSPSATPLEELPVIAGYLERASGEMTFQRYVRHEKAALIGTLCKQKLLAHACKYFKAESCGDRERLASQWDGRGMDAPGPRAGYRFPGGAIEEQEAILQMVRNAGSADWRLRWGLLEIFHLGDQRHVEDYATEYAKIANSVASIPGAAAELSARAEVLAVCETPAERRGEFITNLQRQIAPAYSSEFARVFAQLPARCGDVSPEGPSESAKPEAPKHDKEEPDGSGFLLPGVFGTQRSMSEAERVVESASAQLRLGNQNAARDELVRMFTILQDGGWSIWGGLSASASRAEEMLRDVSASAADLVRAYGPLVKNERHAPPWRIAEHLILKLGSLLGEHDRRLALHHVNEHVGLMVGDASRNCASFEFLGAPRSGVDESIEAFSFVLWLIDHPKWIRRERAATVTAWLVGAEPMYLQRAMEAAFSRDEGYVVELLCGVLDDLSRKDPIAIWNHLSQVVEPGAIFEQCRDVSRIAILHRIAERAGAMGSTSALEAASRIVSAFRAGAITLDSTQGQLSLPDWAACIEPELAALERSGAITGEVRQSLEAELTELCAPLTITHAFALENAVALSFRESPRNTLSRWRAKVRHALNSALVPYASALNFRQVEGDLRILNPAIPERMLNPGFRSHSAAILGWLEGRSPPDLVVSTEESYLLSYQEMTQRGDEQKTCFLEVVAVVVSASLRKRGLFIPPLTSYFKSTELPRVEGAAALPHETCLRVNPTTAFFGMLTPAVPLPRFANLINAAGSDFSRLAWREGRSADPRFFGRPSHEGCLLAVKKDAAQLPAGQKLAWVVRIDGEPVAMTDAENNRLF
jgi:hypothetical protein